MTRSLAAIEAHVESPDFYKPAHGQIFDAMYLLYGRGEPVDVVTVAEELRQRGLLDALGGRAHAAAHPGRDPGVGERRALRRHRRRSSSLLRRLIGVAHDISEMGYAPGDDVAETLDRAESMVFEVAERRVSDSMTQLYPVLEKTMDELAHLYEREGHLTGVPTGYTDIDAILLGLQPSNLVIVAARPGQGKTSFAMGAAAHVALETNKPVLFFSLEMGHLELTRRLLASEAHVDVQGLQTGRLSDHEWTKLNQAVGRLAEAPIFIDDNPHCTVMEMRAKARRIKARYGDIGLIVVDYLQLMTSGKRVGVAPGRGVGALAWAQDPRPRARDAGDVAARSSTASSSTARTSGRCSPTSVRAAASSRTPTS